MPRQETQEVLEDLREREEALRQSEERYRRLVEGSPDMIVVFDSDFRLVDVNASACHDLGYDRDELVGMNLERI